MAPEGRQTGGGPHPEGDKVCDGGDGDGDAGVGQGSAQSILHVQILLTGAQSTTGQQSSQNLHNVSEVMSDVHSTPTIYKRARLLKYFLCICIHEEKISNLAFTVAKYLN